MSDEEKMLPWLLRVCECVRLLPTLDSDGYGGKPPSGAVRKLAEDEITGESPVDIEPATLELATQIAQRGFEWRDEETRRLADRANLLLSAASVVLGLGTAFGRDEFAANSLARGLLIAALIVYLILALLSVLALRPRPLPRNTGYAVNWVWEDTASLHREHQNALRDRVEELDDIARAKACMVAIQALLLALEVLLLTLVIIVTIQEGTG